MKNKKNKRKVVNEVIGWSFNAPFLIFSGVFFIIPIVWAFWLSMLNWNMMSVDKEFVFLDNFIKIATSTSAKAAFVNSFRYLFFIVILSVIASFFIALLVYNLPEKIKGIVAVLFFVPYLSSGVATAVFVRYVLSYNSVINSFLRQIFNINIDWLQDSTWSFWIIVFLIVWKISGYYALFFLSGMESISQEIHEACALDGSSGFNKLVNVVIPIIIPTFSTVIVVASGLAFSIFTEPYLLTGGGPSNSTTTWILEVYNASFAKFESGYGAALALTCAVQIFITLKIVATLMEKLNNKYGA